MYSDMYKCTTLTVYLTNIIMDHNNIKKMVEREQGNRSKIKEELERKFGHRRCQPKGFTIVADTPEF